MRVDKGGRMNINGSELLIILLVALIIFGPRELPKMGRTVGNAVREFRKASLSITDELGLNKLLEDDPQEQEQGEQAGQKS